MEDLANKLKEKVKDLQIKKYKLYKELNNIIPETLSRLGIDYFIVPEIDCILSITKKKEYEFEYYAELSIIEYEKKFIKDEKEQAEEIEYTIEIIEDIGNLIDHEIAKKQENRDKKNNLRKMRLDDLNKLKELRGCEFSYRMQRLYYKLEDQYITYKDEVYYDTIPGTYHDFWKINNTELIKIFKITEDEQRNLKSIISKKEKKRRKNEKRRNDRRNSEGLTKREAKKKCREDTILKLIRNNPRIKKSEVAKILDLNKSTISRTYGHLFK